MLKKVWAVLLALVGVVAGLFFLERKKRLGAEAELQNAGFEGKDQLLQYKQDQALNQVEVEKQRLEELKKEHDKDTKEAQENLKPEQIEEYWRRRNNPK